MLALRLLLVAALVFAARCGGSPTTPTPPPPPPVQTLTIACPANVAVEAEITPVVVDYPAPVTGGGSAPVATACTIASGSAFPAGASDVVCTATDAVQRRAQCTFSVAIEQLFRLEGTKFLAFGDSITEGEVSQPQINVHDVDPMAAYPAVLRERLRERYSKQSAEIVVRNEGLRAEIVRAGEERLIEVVSEHRPDVVLLLEGANDVNQGSLTPGEIVQSLRSNVRRALDSGVRLVLVSTLLPEVPGRPRAFHPEGVEPVNDEIRFRIPQAGGVVVDAWAVFNPQKELLIGSDGLHPTAHGYEVLAETFFKAIIQHFEVAPAMAGAAKPALASEFGFLGPRRSR